MPNTYGLQNPNLVNALNQGQIILNKYLYDMGIATGQSVGYYGPYQTQLDSELHNILGITLRYPLSGDLNGDDTDSYGTFDSSTAGFTFNGKTVHFGTSTDLPVMGDWDNDGSDEIGLYRPDNGGGQSEFHLVWQDWGFFSDGASVDAAYRKVIPFGYYPNNIPIAGDWDGINNDDIGGFCNNQFYLYTLNWGSGTATPYAGDPSLGDPGDKPIIGDWDGDEDDDIGVFRLGADTNYFYLDLGLTGDVHECGPYSLGNVGDEPLIGDWNGNGYDNLGVYRPGDNTFHPRPDLPPTPGIPSNPSPSNHATDVSINTNLDWSDCSNTDFYDVYFGTYTHPPYYGSAPTSNYPFQNDLEYNTKYYWKIVAKSNCGGITQGPIWDFTTEEEPNNPPNTPSIPSGQSSGYTGTSYSYSTSATDPDGDQVKYTFDWADGTTSETGFVNSGTSASKSHSWSSAGTYYVKAKATDSKGASSGWSGTKTVTIATLNNPPNTPSIPSGQSSGYTGTSYSYSTSATDLDGDQVKYTFDWADGTISETGFVNSGTSASKSHSWSSAGTYYVKAKATDSKGASSGWSGTKTVTITVVPCGNMGVNPTSWSPPTINCGDSDSKIVTVSATGGTVEGVTVSKISGPTWLTLSQTNLGDIPSGSSKTFTMTAAPPAGTTSGDYPYTIRVSNTCGSPSTIDVSGTIHVDCFEPNQPPSYSNPSVSPGSGTPSTQFDYSVDVSDPDGDTVTVTLKTYDPSDDSWEDQGNRNVVGSGTASWNDLTPFEANDKGQTAKYTFVFDDGYNSGEWGPFNGPAIETDAGFSNWDYPSTSMATEKIPVEVDISNPHGVKSAWLHYDYGDDGSEDGVTQMSLISVRSAKTEIQGGSSSGLGVKAQKIAVSESAPLSGGGGFGVAERAGIQKSIYLYDAKTCKDVEDSDPYDPIGVTTVFSPTDSVSYTWLQFNDIWSSHTVKWEWYDPNGNFYADCTDMIPDPSDYGYDHWDWYICCCGIYINGYPVAEEEGIWTVKVYLDSSQIETLYFNIEYILLDYTTCKNVQECSPYDPIERTSTFLADDEKAVSWLRLDDVTNSLNVKWEWYDPSGTLYSTWDMDTPDPADEGYDYWGWIKPGCYIYIKDYAAAGKPGEWVVKVYIDDEYEFEEEFTIYPDDARYKCEIPAPGMDYVGDEVSFYVSAYSAYDSPTDSAKHLLDIYVPDGPTLSFSPSSHDFGDKCEGETDSTTFELWNSRTGTLTYTLSESCGWVEVNPTSGSSTGEHDTITVDIDTTGLSGGLHTCDISINSNDGTGTFTVRVNIVPKPDLIITEKWLCWPDNCTICYNVTNTGDGTAPACHNTALYVDDVEVAHDHVPVDLAPGESYIGCFNGYEWGYKPPSGNITVCADNSETLDELDENNNCLINIWMCGDVNGDGKVTMSDVRKVFNLYLDPNYPLDLPWAADVNGDGKVTMSDVRKEFNRYLEPGYELNCCCSGVG